MEDRGRILTIDGKQVTISCGEIGGCYGCMNQECRVSGKILQAENKAGFPLEIGDLVEVGAPASQAVTQALGVFSPPGLLFAAFYAGTAAIFPSSGDSARAAAGVLGLALGFLGVYFFKKIFPPKGTLAVLHVLDGNAKDEPDSSEGEYAPDAY